MPEADETIVTKYVLDAQDAIENSIRLQRSVDDIKDRLHSMAFAAGTDFNIIIKGMREAYEANVQLAKSQLKSVPLNELKDAPAPGYEEAFINAQQTLKDAIVQLNTFNNLAANSASQLRNDYRLTVTAAKEAVREQINFDRQLADHLGTSRKAYTAQVKIANAQLIASNKQRMLEDAQIAKQDAEFQRQLTEHLNDSAERQKRIDQEQTKLREQESKKRADAWRKEANEILKSQNPIKQTTGLFSNLGKVGQFVFGSILGITVLGVIHQLITGFTDLLDRGYRFAKTMYALGAAINVQQMKGANVTIAQTVQLIDELNKKFGVFTQESLARGVSEMYLLTRNFNLTNQQMQDLIEITSQLAIVTGKDFGETAKSLALFISSGYGEALQRAGISVNRVAVVQEAWRLGIKKTYTALTEQERALAAVTLIQNYKNDLDKAAAKYQESMAGKIDVLTKKTNDLANTMGVRLLPLKAAWNKVLLDIATAITKFVGWLGGLFSVDWVADLASRALTPFMLIAVGIEQSKAGITTNLAEMRDKIRKELFDAIKSDAEKWKSEFNLADYLGTDVGALPNQPAPEFTDEEVQAIEDADKEVVELLREMNDKVAEINIELGEKLKEITQEYLDKVAELWEEYKQKIEDINAELARDIAKENEEYARDLEDLERDTQEKLEDANRKYHEEEWKAERDFQEKMRRLREEFLFDLEDALRERDALQVLRLIRRYKLDQEQAQREYENEREERRRAYQLELEDIRRQAERKRAELAREHAQRLADLEAEAERERQLAYENYMKEKEAAKKEAEEKAAEAKTEAAAALEELKTWLKERLETIVNKLMEEADLTEEQLRRIAGVWGAYFGKHGAIEATGMYYTNMINNLIQHAQSQVQVLAKLLQDAINFANQINNLNRNDANTPSEENAGNPSGNAFGGSVYAASATTAVFGEAGPEVATFTPLTKLNTRGFGTGLSPYRGGMGSNGGNDGGLTAIRISLSPYLIAEIIEQAMNQQAKVFVDILNER